jgi:crotonobetainyl-CoA:carnitine CoA-transferase CaiB-like acyl-CoA transferase
VYIACNTDKQAHAVFRVIGRADLIDKAGFAKGAERWANHDEIDEIVGAWTRVRTKRETFDAMIAADVPCGVVMDIEEVLNDDDLNARGVFGEVDQPGIGTLRLPRSPIIFDERAAAHAAPLLGEHNASVYGELLGFDAEQLETLAAGGVITE